ncbi:hypothetical protein SeGA_1521 [Salmonella enterica subsp. enterica serovar Gaminara str. A4-567]|nr:hypothetical protein SeGA_1521 [Salmonella enterica subsp. enterica serovar Gaminara str. A4-567]
MYHTRATAGGFLIAQFLRQLIRQFMRLLSDRRRQARSPGQIPGPWRQAR